MNVLSTRRLVRFVISTAKSAIDGCRSPLWRFPSFYNSSFPPDPWDGKSASTTARVSAPTRRDGKVAHGPSFPPDPWDGKVAHGPSFPPDPWDGKVAHGPSIPPDPWDGKVAHGPIFPHDPWDGKI